MAFFLAVVYAVVLLCVLFIIRLCIVVKIGPSYQPGKKGSVAVVVVAGSGGHTSEILRLMECLSAAYTPRHYVIADTDRMSEEKICTFERSKHSESESQYWTIENNDSAKVDLEKFCSEIKLPTLREEQQGSLGKPTEGEEILWVSDTSETCALIDQFTICRIPRSREVHQSWSSSVISTLKALHHAVPLVFRLRPDVVLCNGPGTCVPLCLAALLLGILGIKKVLIVYVESICRVQTLSLTGKILYPISDYFYVQWASLRDKYPKSVFLGRIV